MGSDFRSMGDSGSECVSARPPAHAAAAHSLAQVRW
jgi:hypothetical protein